jgi:broad specificity phosphatase PhoE
MRVLLIRHGETEWNREGIFRGRKDIPLNDNGIRQAEALAESLSGLDIAAVYSSPLSRAARTALPIAGVAGLPDFAKEEALIDIDFGIWQGLTIHQVETGYPDDFKAWKTNPSNARIPGGEPLGAVLERSSALLVRLRERHPDDTITLVSHRVVAKVMLCYVLGLDNSHFFSILQSNCCLNIFDMNEDGFVLRLLNDTCHLRNLEVVGSDF